jgi:hypothetical protein
MESQLLTTPLCCLSPARSIPTWLMTFEPPRTSIPRFGDRLQEVREENYAEVQPFPAVNRASTMRATTKSPREVAALSSSGSTISLVGFRSSHVRSAGGNGHDVRPRLPATPSVHDDRTQPRHRTHHAARRRIGRSRRPRRARAGAPARVAAARHRLSPPRPCSRRPSSYSPSAPTTHDRRMRWPCSSSDWLRPTRRRGSPRFHRSTRRGRLPIRSASLQARSKREERSPASG